MPPPPIRKFSKNSLNLVQAMLPNIKWTPPFARESSTSESLSEAEASVAGLQALNSPLVNPIVTPRWKQSRRVSGEKKLQVCPNLLSPAAPGPRCSCIQQSSACSGQSYQRVSISSDQFVHDGQFVGLKINDFLHKWFYF